MSTNELTNMERKKLLYAAKRIHTYKLMQAKGYGILAKKAKDERIKQLLLRISADEASHTEFWFEIIKKLGGKHEGAAKTFLRDWKVSFMMRILGTKGFFEWSVIGEEEGILDLIIQAENIKDVATSEAWSRTASDERLHLERMKAEVLGMEVWEIRGGGGVRDMIFGANDGLVSTLAFVVGAFGAFSDSHIVLLTGIAELFAGTISMAVGSYQSSKSELEVLERESQRKKVKGKTPEEERTELIKFYESEGFKREEAEAIVDRIAEEKELPTQVGALEELGLAPEELGNPVKAGLLCGVFFALGALVPILPFAFTIGAWEALIASVIGTVATLFGVGAMKTIFSRKSWVRSGLEMMVIGISAAAITYMIGTLFSLIV
ncbi:MAG: VIT1/CCC1 transporter family protein [Candidatus Bathyarchaeota archaeon]|jgi:predicted membrane protein (TIGR00267 family)